MEVTIKTSCFSLFTLSTCVCLLGTEKEYIFLPAFLQASNGDLTLRILGIFSYIQVKMIVLFWINKIVLSILLHRCPKRYMCAAAAESQGFEKKDKNLPVPKAHLCTWGLTVDSPPVKLQLPTVTEVSWLCLLDSKWPNPVMAWQAPEDNVWSLVLMPLDLGKFAVTHLLFADDAFPWKTWYLGWSFDSLMIWNIMFLPNSQWVTFSNTKYCPSSSLAFSLWELAVTPRGSLMESWVLVGSKWRWPSKRQIPASNSQSQNQILKDFIDRTFCETNL